MKTQMRFQKILALVTLITAALSIILAFFFCSGVILESMYYNSEYGKDLGKNPIGADGLYNFAQMGNNLILIAGIVLLVASVLLYITNCNKRRNYYKSNKVAIIIFAVVAFVYAVVMMIVVIGCFVNIGKIDFVKWKSYVDYTKTNSLGDTYHPYNQNYSENPITLVLGILISILVLAEAAAWIYNYVWKIKLMKGEKELLKAGLAKEVA